MPSLWRTLGLAALLFWHLFALPALEDAKADHEKILLERLML